MNVLLIASDSKIPNLALMKISAYHKAQGDQIGFNVSDPDLIYISRIFREGGHNTALYPNAEIIQGGPGFNNATRLPPEIEATPPDQDLYDSEYSIARVTSGCPRRCKFCMVHELEPGGIRYIMSPEDQWKPGTVLRLLDDNILAMPKAFWEVHEFSISNNAKVKFEYLDIRLVTPEIAKGLREIHHHQQIYFAFDYSSIETSVRKGIEILRSAGHPSGSLCFYLYYENEEMTEDVKKRFKIVRELGAVPFVMADGDNKTQGMIRIARKANNKRTVKTFSIDEIFDPILTIENIIKRHKEGI